MHIHIMWIKGGPGGGELQALVGAVSGMFIVTSVVLLVLEIGGGSIQYILKYVKTFFNFKLEIIEDVNLWGPLWQIIIENISLF